MTTNQNGIFTEHNNTYQVLQAGLNRKLKHPSSGTWDWTYGVDFVYGLAQTSTLQANQYWLGLRFKWIVLRVGAESSPIQYAGLSSTNGNMDWSNNSQPLPGVTLTTNKFIPFFFGKKWFSFHAEYQENYLQDKRNVNDPHLHHKNLYLRFKLPASWNITAGLEHWVFWRGTSNKYGKLPGFSDYLRYILGRPGSSHALPVDIANAEGNTLGLYIIKIEKRKANASYTFYYNHPFEDASGVEMANLRDGLWGIYIHRNKKSAFLTDLVIEYMNTRNQSGSIHLAPAPTPENPNRKHGRGKDDYFNHGVYSSGFVYENHMMGTPFFIPYINSEGISEGFKSTRMWMQHIGLKGNLARQLNWRAMFSWSRNFGTYNNPYPTPFSEFSYLTECQFHPNKMPINFRLGVAGDTGQRFEERIGSYAGISYFF